MKTIRGFEVQRFRDDYGHDCSIQESSSVNPHIWLGVNNPPHRNMWDDAESFGIKIEAKSGRMYLSQEQAKSLAKKLLYFAKHGVLKEEKEKEKWQHIKSKLTTRL